MRNSIELVMKRYFFIEQKTRNDYYKTKNNFYDHKLWLISNDHAVLQFYLFDLDMDTELICENKFVENKQVRYSSLIFEFNFDSLELAELIEKK